MPDEQVTSKDTTETRILISEDKFGNFSVEHQTIIKGTEITIPIRNSHLIGQLFVAAVILLMKSYKRLLNSESKSNSSLKDGDDSAKDSKVP